MQTEDYIRTGEKIPDHWNFWHCNSSGYIKYYLLVSTFFWTYHVTWYILKLHIHFTKNTFCTLIEMKMLTSYKKGISFLRRWRRQGWGWWWWPPPLVLDWQPWGLWEVCRNWSRRMLLKVWRNLFNKTKLRLRLPARKLSIVCYNTFFLLKM